jgi:hypothetical protein
MQLDFEAWSRALAIVESGDNPDVGLGDDGRAAGRWQQHPSFYEQWSTPIPHGTEPTWDERFAAALRNFYDAAVRFGVDDVDAACGFHLTGQPRSGSAASDTDGYAARFRAAAGL